MIVTARLDADPCAFARFTWSDDLQDCDLLALGLDDNQLDALLAAKVHEGADLEGYTVTID